jgi:hypothetical protein
VTSTISTTTSTICICTPGELQPCGNCGNQRCNADCLSWGPCLNEGSCSPGSVSCVGNLRRVCLPTCELGSASCQVGFCGAECCSDNDCNNYEQCDCSEIGCGRHTDLDHTCYDLRPSARGCNYYDYCENGRDPDNPAVPCSSNWPEYCYSVTDPTGIHDVCVDSSYANHTLMTCPWS